MTMFNADGTEMNLEQRSQRIRDSRNKYLSLYVDSINAVRWSTFTDEEKQAWINYRQELLNVPNQPGFPDDITWPIKP